MRVGVLTGGGDCPGLNAVIRAVVRKGVQTYGYEFVGFRDGWRGPLENVMGDTLGRPSCGTIERAPPAGRDGSLGSMATVTRGARSRT